MRLALGDALARVVAFGLSVYLARTLGPAVYGTVALAMAAMLYASCVVDCGLDMLGVRDIAAAPEQAKELIPSLSIMRLLVAVAVLVVLIIAGLAAAPQPDGAMLAAYSLSLLAIALNTKWAVLGLGNPGTVGAARTVAELSAAAIALTLVRQPGDVVWVPVGAVTGEAVASLLLLLTLARLGLRLPLAFDAARVRPVVRRSWPLAGHALLGLVIFNSGFFFLRAFHDAATVGRYAVAYTLVSFCTNVGVMYGFSLLAPFTRLRSDAPAERALYDDAQASAFALALPVALGTTLLAAAIMHLAFGADYSAGTVALQLLIWSVPVALFRNVAVGLLIARDRQHDVFLTTVWAALINVALNLVLIPPFGMPGAAASIVVTELLRTVTALWYAGRAGLPLTPARRFWRAALAAVVMTVVLMAARPPLWAAVPLGAVVYGATLAGLGGIRMARGSLPRLSV